MCYDCRIVETFLFLFFMLYLCWSCAVVPHYVVLFLFIILWTLVSVTLFLLFLDVIKTNLFGDGCDLGVFVDIVVLFAVCVNFTDRDLVWFVPCWNIALVVLRFTILFLGFSFWISNHHDIFGIVVVVCFFIIWLFSIVWCYWNLEEWLLLWEHWQ